MHPVPVRSVPYLVALVTAVPTYRFRKPINKTPPYKAFLTVFACYWEDPDPYKILAVRIWEAQKHSDEDQDPQHWLQYVSYNTLR